MLYLLLLLIIAILLVFLFAKKERNTQLQAVALIVGVLALLPFVLSVISFAVHKPAVSYCFHTTNLGYNKSIKRFVHEARLILNFERGSVLVDQLLLQPGWGAAIAKHPIDTSEFNPWANAIEGSPMTVYPFFDMAIEPPAQTGRFFLIYTKSDTCAIGLNIHLRLRPDPYKLGWFTVFQPESRFRYSAELEDFCEETPADGYLRP